MPDTTLHSPGDVARRAPSDLDASEQDVAAWMGALGPAEVSPLLGARLLSAFEARRPRRSYAGLAAVAAALILAFGLVGFSRAATRAAEAGCQGARCAEPIVAVVDDPQVPLYRSLEALAAFDGEAGCWEALADLGDGR